MYTFGQTSPTLLFAYVLYGCTKRKDYNHRHSTAKQKAESREQRAESREKSREQSEELQLQAQQRPTNFEKPFWYFISLL